MRAHILSLSCLTCVASAADMEVRDLRLGVGSGQVSGYDQTFTYTSGANSKFASGETKLHRYDGDDPGLIFVSFTKGSLGEHGGFLWSVGAEGQSSEESVSGESFTSTAIAATLRLGYGYAFNERFHIELMPEAALGYLSVEDADVTAANAIDRSTAEGSVVSGGLSVAGFCRIGRGFLLGATLRAAAVSFKTEADFDRTGGHYDSEGSYVFLSAAVTGGWRF